jgi:phosphoribosylformylglycinamidine cyclo-ligase
VENIPRILPDGLGARVDRHAWQVPPLFQLIQETGSVDPLEMYRVFNMGIGMVVVVAAQDVISVQAAVAASTGEAAPLIGEIVLVDEGPRVIL